MPNEQEVYVSDENLSDEERMGDFIVDDAGEAICNPS